MGFWNKLKNWTRGKGWKETTESEIEKWTDNTSLTKQEPITEQTYNTEPEEQQAEQETKRETEKPIEQRKRLNIKSINQKELQSKIDHTIINKVRVDTSRLNLTEYQRDTYTKLFTEQQKLKDETILQHLIETRGAPLLRSRYTCTANMYAKLTKTGQGPILIATITMNRLLLEEIQQVEEGPLRKGEIIWSSQYKKLLESEVNKIISKNGGQVINITTYIADGKELQLLYSEYEFDFA